MRFSEFSVMRETGRRRRNGELRRWLAGAMIFFASGLCAYAQQGSADFLSALKWRLIGPHRAGRVTAVAGIAGNPAIYYMGTPGGGVWKTTDGGVVWKPIFDDMHVASIGALALAPSNPDVIYVGTGEQTDGQGVYKSTDAGATWKSIGLLDTHVITALLVDPKDPNIVLAGAYGDATPSAERGVFKSTDGGNTWRKVLFKDDRSGILDMGFDPHDSKVVYASLLTGRADPTEKKPAEPSSNIYKSTDKGETWKLVGQTGLPAENRGRIGVAVAAGNKGKRVFAIMNQGLFRSDDAGANWTAISSDTRVIGSGYFSRVFVDPKDPDLVYVMQTTVYRSKDGGRTFSAFKGAPSGEDHHVFWIAPDDPKRILLGSDQGATITVDSGESWSIWFNQPTGQFYHVSTDNTFPYHLYAAQQDSGSIVVPNRSDFGEITYRDWYSGGGFESGYIAADPLNPNFVYSVGWFGTVLRLDRSSNQIATIFVPPAKYRTAWETPLVLSARDPHAIYYGAQFVLKTSDGGVTWREISPDLTAKSKADAEIPPVEKQSGNRDPDEEPQLADRGVIQTVAVSPADAKTIWVGTNNGLMHLTRDETTWQDVTLADLPSKSFVNLIEASPSDANTAYAAVIVRRDRHPYFYRTRDAGKSWQKIVSGLAESGIARVVREDPTRPDLLYAGTETGAYVSFDSGDHWQTLQLNLPITSVRDLAIHGNDLVAATFGRGLWIIDDVALLRQISGATSNSEVHFFTPDTALRVRWDNHPDTPLSAETPAGANPLEGAVIDYFLNAAPKRELTLDVLDASGNRVQRFSSVAPSHTGASPPNVPEYWFAPPEVLPAKAGANRFAWDLRYPHPTALTYGYYGERLEYTEYTLPDHAIPGETPRHQPQGPLVVPGKYQLVLTVDGKSYRQPLQVELDPRVHLSQEDLVAQLELAKKLTAWMDGSAAAFNRVIALHGAVKEKTKLPENAGMTKDLASSIAEFEKQLSTLEDGSETTPGSGPLNRDFGRYLTMVESGDYRPGESAHKAAVEACESLKKNISAWNKLIAEALPSLNKSLEQAKLPALPSAAALEEMSCAN